MLKFNELQNRLPTAFQSFAELRAGGAVYVDKTVFVQALAENRQPRILTRPRRFGKSTLLSTLEELFLHGIEPYDGHDSYFKGLAIEKTWHDQGHYPVLHLDFYNLNFQCDTVAEFEHNLMQEIASFCRKHELRIPEKARNFSEQFNRVLELLPDYSLVLLVDEYDSPLLYHMEDEKELHDCKELLRALFGLVKIYSRKYRCVFFTGITRIQDLGIGTAGNSFTDISMKSSFAACCGYTREELKHGFADHLRYAAAVILGIGDTEVTETQIESLLDEMAEWYDGYSFDGKATSKVFSTWSVLRFFGDEEALLQPYWSDEEGLGLPLLLKVTLNRIRLPQLLDELSSGRLSISRHQFLQSSLVNPQASAYALLCQVGYLTLCEPFAGCVKVYLDCPNKELRIAFTGLMARCLLNLDNYSEDYSETQKLLESLDIDRICAHFNRFFNALPYEHYPVENEAMVRALIHFYLYGAGIKPLPEAMSSKGRADTVINLPHQKLTLIFEYKYEPDSDERKLDARLHEALEQLKTRDYGLNALSEPTVARFALVFCGAKEKRALVRWALADVSHLQSIPRNAQEA